MTPDEGGSQARRALASIVAAPDLGPSALSAPGILANVLADYMPEAPRETAVLLAASRADVAGALTAHAGQGMDPATSIRITSASLAADSGYNAEMSLWAVAEIAVALGLASTDQMPALSPPSQRTSAGGQLDRTTDPGPVPAEPVTVPRAPARTRRWLLPVTAAVLVIVAASGGAALYVTAGHVTAGRAGSSGTTPASHPAASPALPPAAVTFACKVESGVLGNGLDYEVTAQGGAAYGGTVNVDFYDYLGTGDKFAPISLDGTAVLGSPANWHRVPAADIGASAEPSGCTANAASSPAASPAGSSAVPAGSGPWTASELVITPHYLGAVTIGMSLAQASAAAGVHLEFAGDTVYWPNGSSQSGLAVGMPYGPSVWCVSAAESSTTPVVSTPQGFLLGGTVQALKALYGSRLQYVAENPDGPSPRQGYVVAFPDGNLAFAVDNGTVTSIIGGGRGVIPSVCH